MKKFVLLVWSICYPFMIVLAGPFWLIKMWRRGGWGSGLGERIGRYDRDEEFERQGGIYMHAVSVGETLLALKVIAQWQKRGGGEEAHFILVPTTATGLAIAKERAPAGVRVIYAPLDFGFLIRRTMARFTPIMVIMVESELWPNLIEQSGRMGIPVRLMNARLSPRSGRRLKKFKRAVAPFISQLDRIAVPEDSDVKRWEEIGARKEALKVVANIKFDPEATGEPQKRPDFAKMLEAFEDLPIIMGVSTFAGEEEVFVRAIREAGGLPVMVPRHAERRDEVTRALDGKVVLRSRFKQPEKGDVFVIDSTGELRDWTAHADVVLIGKSFLEKGGQNPTEAILAGVPVISGPYMANFEPLVTELREAGGLVVADGGDDLAELITRCLEKPRGQVEAATRVIARHRGAVKRTIDWLGE